MGWPRRVVFVRHGQSEGNLLTPEERVTLDMPTYEYGLTPRGHEQARITGELLRKNFGKFDSYFCSYYKRAYQTVNHIVPLGACVRIDSLLAEANRGIWHTMTHDQVLARFPEEAARKKREGLYHYRPLGGENWPDIEQRAWQFLLKLNLWHEGEEVCVVGHKHSFLCFQRLLHPVTDTEELLRRYRDDSYLKNASVTIYELASVNNRPRLVLRQENIVPWEGVLHDE